MSGDINQTTRPTLFRVRLTGNDRLHDHKLTFQQSHLTETSKDEVEEFEGPTLPGPYFVLANAVGLVVLTIVSLFCLRQNWWLLLLIPVVGNASEHATACAVSLRDKADLAMGVMIGTAIQISILMVGMAGGPVYHCLSPGPCYALRQFRRITVFLLSNPAPTRKPSLLKHHVMEPNLTHVWDLSPGVYYVDIPPTQRTVCRSYQPRTRRPPQVLVDPHLLPVARGLKFQARGRQERGSPCVCGGSARVELGNARSLRYEHHDFFFFLHN